ncbi:unnamed protein product [Caenorhabditis bovis]|uniref:Peroxiredoxin-like 2A n=1 Tax=Caenorhabditis bovis TaxID=2654633 RepID=A0A8S1EVD3_9PELO|nr:unnamed protein product [Caenorhabditis bovis]
MEMLGFGALAALGSAIFYANLPTRLTIGAVAPSFSYLAQAKLLNVKGGVNDAESVDESESISGAKLFEPGPILVMAVRRPGCLLCRREAAQLYTLQPFLKEHGIRMAAVVHETLGANKFKEFFPSDVYLDTERHFYGPNERWLPIWMGFLRFGTYANVYRAKKAKIDGNLEGEGRLLGGVYLIANNEIVYTHLEKEWGDAADIDEVSAAVHKFIKTQ